MTNRPDEAAFSQVAWRDRLLAAYRRRGWRGFLFLHRLLKPPAGRPELRTISRYGSQFSLVPGDEIDRHVLVEGFYESEVFEAVRPFLAPQSVLWVVGANFGLHAITAKLLHPAAQVVAFEPSPAMGARILENCKINGLTIDLHSYALSDRTGVSPFFSKTSGNPGMSTLHPTNPADYDRKFHVGIRTAAEIIEHGAVPAPTALIVDAEGAEIDIFRGFRAHLAAPSLRAVVFEAPNDFLATRLPRELDALLRAAGFSFKILPRKEDTAHALSNFVALRS